LQLHRFTTNNDEEPTISGGMERVSGKSYILCLAAALAAAPPVLIAQGTINSALGTSPAGPVNAITQNSPVGNGFTLTLSGSFHTNQVSDVHWYNTAYNSDTTFNIDGQLNSVSSTQITLTIPPYLFSGSATTRQTIQIYETEYVPGNDVPVSSNVVNFYINPGMLAGTWYPNPVTVGTPYTTDPIEVGGTPPYTTQLSPGYTFPSGLSIDRNTLSITGTPTGTNGTGGFSPLINITDAWGNLTFAYLYLQIYPRPVITPPLLPAYAPAGSPSLTVTINGTGFLLPVYGEGITPGSGVTWTQGGTPVDLPSTVISTTQIQAVIPYNLLAAPGTGQIQVIQPDGSPSNAVPFAVVGPVISYLSPGSAVAGVSGLTLTVGGSYFSNGGGQYFSAPITSRLRGNLAAPVAPRAPVATAQVYFGSTQLATTYVNSTTLTAQVPANLLTTPGSVAVTVVNPGGFVSNSATFTVVPAVPALEISGTPPQGTVGVAYSTSFAASGGTPGYQFSLSSGTLPPRLKLAANGTLAGTPTQAGQFRAVIQVTDSTGANTSSLYLITIVTPPLTLNGTIGDMTVGTSVNVAFTATGGTQPYVFSAAGSLPSGLTFLNGTIQGTTNSAGTFTFAISVTDKTSTVATKNFTVKVTVGPLTIGGTLGNGQVGVAYTGQVSATGGTGSYTFSATGMPPGTTLSASGAATGTPNTAGTFSAAVTVTDGSGNHSSQSFSITIAPAPLTVTTPSLPDGLLQTAYAAVLNANGGTQPYTWSVTGLPSGVIPSSDGSLSGKPTVSGTFSVTATVTDAKGTTANKTYSLLISIARLSITTDGLPSALVGATVSGSVSATGGVQPYQFSATGLPAGVSLGSDGTLSGAPTAPGTASVTVVVMDSKGTTANKILPMIVTLPTPPSVTFSGLPTTTSPASQPTVTINLGSKFPTDVVAALTLTFAPDSGSDDPSVQFSTGGRTTQLTVPAGSTVSPGSIGVQTGTVAGLITITAHLTAASQDITGTPIPTITIRVNAVAPVLSSVTATRNSSGFTVTVTGFASARDITQAIFTFTAASGTTLTSSTATIAVDSIFNGWFQSSSSAQFGSQFLYTQPFTVSSGASSIVSVTVTLVSKEGNSNTLSATLQ
jgi:large repetitive protein